MPIAPVRVRLAVLLAAALAAVLPAGVAGAAWRVPVEGVVARSFDLGSDPFEAGRHRGVDLAAAPGDRVRAPCAGRVAVAGQVGTSGRVVTVVCGRWRVSHMPLATIAVHPEELVLGGDALGTVASSRDHAGLHLGVRRDGSRFGYVDPLRFLGADRAPPPLAPVRRPPRSPTVRTRPPALPRTVRAPRRLPVRARVPSPSRPPALPRTVRAPQPARGPVPWPAWLGLALVLAGLGVHRRGHGGKPRAPRPAPIRERAEAT
jgi:hypothetical protein